MTDHAALAEKHDAARASWNEKFREAAEASVIETLLTLCHTVLAAEPTAVTIQLGPSDQGNWMLFEHVTLPHGGLVETLGEGTEHEVSDSDLWDHLTCDLPNDGGWQTMTWVHEEYCSYGRRTWNCTLDPRKAIAYWKERGHD